MPLPRPERQQAGERSERFTRALVADTPWYANASVVLQQWRDNLFLHMQRQYAAVEKAEYGTPEGEQKPIVRWSAGRRARERAGGIFWDCTV